MACHTASLSLIRMLKGLAWARPVSTPKQRAAVREDVRKGEDIAVGDVEDLVARAVRALRPVDGPRQKPRVRRLDRCLGPARIGQRQAQFTADGGIDADGAQDIDRAADREADDVLWPKHRPRPAGPLLPRADQVFLLPVEVGMRMARRALLARQGDWPKVAAIGLGALQHGQVLQPQIAWLDRVEEVLQHTLVADDLLGLAPGVVGAGTAEQRAIDGVGDAPHLGQLRAAVLGARQVDGDEAGAGFEIGRAPRQGDDLTVRLGFEMRQHSAADDAERAGDDHLFGHWRPPCPFSGCGQCRECRSARNRNLGAG